MKERDKTRKKETRGERKGNETIKHARLWETTRERARKNETKRERTRRDKKDGDVPRKSKTNEKQQVKIRNNMKEQNKVRKIGTHREIAKQLDNKLRHKGKQTRQHGKERNALRNQATRERTARHDK